MLHTSVVRQDIEKQAGDAQNQKLGGKMEAPVNILIADDQPYLKELFCRDPNGKSYSVLSACDAESVDQCLEDSTPDLVLLEISLNGFEGWDVLHHIKNKRPHLPVLIVTSYDSYLDDPRVTEADGYVVKDFVCSDRLKEAITKVLGRKKVTEGAGMGKEEQIISPLPQPTTSSPLTQDFGGTV
jgi:CheY-like chemotaxis protein